jgi:hypothetical protein
MDTLSRKSEQPKNTTDGPYEPRYHVFVAEEDAHRARVLLASIKEDLELSLALRRQVGPVLYGTVILVEAGVLWAMQQILYMGVLADAVYRTYWFSLLTIIAFELVLWRLRTVKNKKWRTMTATISPRILYFVFLNVLIIAAYYWW